MTDTASVCVVEEGFPIIMRWDISPSVPKTSHVARLPNSAVPRVPGEWPTWSAKKDVLNAALLTKRSSLGGERNWLLEQRPARGSDGHHGTLAEHQ